MSSSTSSEVVVRTRHLGKAYQLYAHRSDWLKQVMFGHFKTYYKPFWVLRDIDLDVYRGDSIGILGRNGCGKSTLLQVICGMTLPSNGELRVKYQGVYFVAQGWPRLSVWRLANASSPDPLKSFFPFHVIWPGFAINTALYAVILWLLF